MTESYPKLLSPIDVGSIRLRNRIVFRAHRTNLAGSGRVSEALTAYYQARARGGCGAVVVGDITFHPGDRPYEKMIEVYTEDGASDLEQLAQTVKADGASAFAQVVHRGFQSHGAISRLPLWGPVPTADVVYGEVCHKMGTDEISEVTDALAQGAAVIKQKCFDGVVVSIGPNSLLRQFLSPLTNSRDDEYGGDTAGRLRFSLDVLTAIREAVGLDFPVCVDLCLDEMFYGALGPEEALDVARRLDASGLVDLFFTTVGTYYNLNLARASMHHPAGLTLERVAALKEAVSRPVAAGNRISSPHMAEEVLSLGRADLIAWQRPLICDPELPNKLMEGREAQIVDCVYDNQGCVGRTNRDRTIGCVRNPWAGDESKQHAWPRSEAARRVVVIGAGPAGMEAAHVAATRGHDVQLFEGEDEPGGQLRLARRQPGRAELGEVVNQMSARLERSGIRVRYGCRLDAAAVLELQPEVVILAAGSSPHPQPVPGEYGPPGVISVQDLIGEIHPVGKRVLIIDEDGHFKAPLAALLLADRGNRVEMMTSELFVGLDLAGQGDLSFMRQQLDSRGIPIHCDQVVSAIRGTEVETLNKHTGATHTWSGYDTVVTAMRQVPADNLYKALKGKGFCLLRAGDCVAPRRMDAAIREGHLAGLKVL